MIPQPQTAEDYLRKADQAFDESRNPHEALSHLLTGAGLDAKNPDTHREIGRVLSNMGVKDGVHDLVDINTLGAAQEALNKFLNANAEKDPQDAVMKEVRERLAVIEKRLRRS